MTRRAGAPKIYLAGPGVFRRDAAAFAAHLKALCDHRGLKGMWPADAPGHTSRLIFRYNVELIRAADALVADISPFRGPHADDGTAFEIGVAYALGKPVFAWTDDTNPLAARIPGAYDGGELRDTHAFRIEDFAAPANLMLVEACHSISGSPEEAITAAAKHFRTYLRPV